MFKWNLNWQLFFVRAFNQKLKWESHGCFNSENRRPFNGQISLKIQQIDVFFNWSSWKQIKVHSHKAAKSGTTVFKNSFFGRPVPSLSLFCAIHYPNVTFWTLVVYRSYDVIWRLLNSFEVSIEDLTERRAKPLGICLNKW